MQTVLRQLVSVIGGEAAVRIANFAAALLIARVYGVATLGTYAGCLAVVTVTIMFADNGLQICAITELSENRGACDRILGELYLCKTVLILAAVVFLAAIALSLKSSGFVWAIAAWITMRTVLQSYSQLQMAVLKVSAKASLIGGTQAIQSLLLLCWIWKVYASGSGIYALLCGLCTGQLLEFAAMVVISKRLGIQASLPKQSSYFLKYLRKSTPLGITYGLANLILRADTIVLALLVSSTELGDFSAANAVLAMVYVASWLFGSLVLPEMVRRSGSKDSLNRYATSWVRLVVLGLTPCAIVAFWMAPKLTVLLYGSAYHRSGSLASVMALATPFIFLNSIYTNIAVATGSKSVLMWLFATTAIAAVILDLLLGRSFGSIGVAWAILVREAGMSAVFRSFTLRAPEAAGRLEYPFTL